MVEAVRDAYGKGEEDESLEPRILADPASGPIGRIGPGDHVIFYDIRGEREIELTESFTEDGFDKFPTKRDLNVEFTTMVEYDAALKVEVAFPPLERIGDTLCEVVSRNQLKQVKVVESEKAVHVSYFLNGKTKDAFPDEERVIVPSPKDPAKKPEMSISSVTRKVIAKLDDDRYDLIICNVANADVVGHIEDEDAIRRALEATDYHMGLMVDAARRRGVTVVLTADHGTVEKWLYPEGAIDTGHTDSPVPFILVDPAGRDLKLREGGGLIDVAPTVLSLLGLPKPEVMTGRSLIETAVPKRSEKRRRVLLPIADGWGVSERTEGNLIAKSKTPVMDFLETTFPYTLIKAAGEAVGMPEGTVGNSEVGHLHLGCGRHVPSDRLRINRAIDDGSFFENDAFLSSLRGALRKEVALHFLGIVSFYSSHGSLDHLMALLKLAKREGLSKVYIHALLGRRGERPESGARYIEQVTEETRRLGLGEVVSVIGRFWALDREENWDRVEKTYRALVYGEGIPVITC
jgi:2,3-bisphosphoglycerate-independent phosphoglycerate mutase